MIIGFEAKRVFQNSSGLGNYSRNTISLLARHYPDNRLKLFAPKLTNLYQLPDSAEIILPETFLSKYFGSYWRLYQTTQLLKCHQIDLFHGLSHVLPFGIEKTGIPSVVTVHDLIFLRFPQFYKKVDRELYQAIYRSSCNRATKIIAISHQTKDDIVRFYGIDPDKIVVVYQSCHLSFYGKVTDTQKSAVRLKFGLPESFLLCVGTIEKRKNQLGILKALAKVKCTTTIVLLGRATDYKEELDLFIRESGLNEHVIFLLNSSTDELQAIYQMAEAMVYPSYFEGFGLPVLEAQASGCPVITSNISSLPEAGGDGALYVDPENDSEIGEAVLKILSDKKFKAELIHKGIKNAARFSDKVVAANLMEVYRKVAKMR